MLTREMIEMLDTARRDSGKPDWVKAIASLVDEETLIEYIEYFNRQKEIKREKRENVKKA